MRPPAWILAPEETRSATFPIYNPSRPCAFIQVPHYHREWVGRAPSKAYLSSEVYSINREDVATELPAVYAIIPLSLISRLANRVTRFEQLRIRSTTPPRASNKMDAFSSCVASFSSRRHEWCGLSFGSLIHQVAQEACSQTSSGPQSALTYFPTALMIGG